MTVNLPQSTFCKIPVTLAALLGYYLPHLLIKNKSVLTKMSLTSKSNHFYACVDQNQDGICIVRTGKDAIM